MRPSMNAWSEKEKDNVDCCQQADAAVSVRLSTRNGISGPSDNEVLAPSIDRIHALESNNKTLRGNGARCDRPSHQ